MSNSSQAATAWARLSGLPGGKWLFTRIVTWKSPYASSIRPAFTELRPGYCEARICKHRAVLNHIGTVHAIAMCNLVELVGGTMMEVTVPRGYRWIPRGMSVEYLAKATSDVRAVAELAALPELADSTDVPVTVNVFDASDKVVLRAVITILISRKPAHRDA